MDRAQCDGVVAAMNSTTSAPPAHPSGRASVLVWSAAPLDAGVREALDAALQGTDGSLLISHDREAALALLARPAVADDLAGTTASDPQSLPDSVVLQVLAVQQLDQVGTARALAKAAPKAGPHLSTARAGAATGADVFYACRHLLASRTCR